MKNGIKKSVKKSVRGKPFKNGHDPRRGKGPAAGTGGRPSDSAIQAAREIVGRANLWAVLQKIAERADRAADRISATKLLLAYAYGQPKETVEHTGSDGGSIDFVLRMTDADFNDPL